MSPPCRARASFQARLWASMMPLFMPWPPAGLLMWAASPASSTRPSRKWGLVRQWMWKALAQTTSASPGPKRAAIRRWTPSGEIAASSLSSGARMPMRRQRPGSK
ncbi:hypothetical protein D3C86_1295650 [compost metagenome]